MRSWLSVSVLWIVKCLSASIDHGQKDFDAIELINEITKTALVSSKAAISRWKSLQIARLFWLIKKVNRDDN
jgi:hypothetical protein